MLPSDLLTIGCLAFTAISIWVGSYYFPNRSQSKHSPAVEESVQPSPQPAYYPNPFVHLPNRWTVFHDGRPVPNISPSDFRLNGYEDYIRRGRVDGLSYHRWGLVPSRFGRTQKNTTQILVENWRKSILGLIALSESNLRSAEEHLRIGDEGTAVQKARTAVENMARALIHCCGGKPDPDPGQEEVLRILSQRFKAEMKTEFDNAVDKIAYIQINQKAKQTLQIASEITHTLKKVVLNNFGKEVQNHVSSKMR